jgi:hypothetical protein
MHEILSELHYITLNHLSLLEYNYIVVPPPSEFFVSAYLHVGGVQEFLTVLIFMYEKRDNMKR